MKWPKSPLEDLLVAYRPTFAALAQSWLSTGALSFEVWADDHRLACWTGDAAAPPSLAVLTASIQTRSGEGTRGTRETTGTLRVGGTFSPDAQERQQHRLNAEALLVADLAGLEAEQERMVAELIDMQDQLLALYDLTQSRCYHTYYQEVEHLLHCLAREIVRLLNVEGGVMFFTQHEQVSHQVHYPETLDDAIVHALVSLTRTATCELLLNHDSAPPEPEPELAARDPLLPPGVTSLLYIPIQIREEVRAGVALLNKAGGFTAPDLKLVRAIAEQVGARIDNVLLHLENLEQARLQTEMRMAREVQFRLMPQRLPAIAGLDLYADWRPARQASGDFYDLIARPDRPLIATVGDVSGKGMPAALLTVETMTEIRSQARILLDPTPAALMRCLNESLYDDFNQAEMLATVFIARYEPACRELTCASAGHAPVIYCPAEGSPLLLKADGPPIGVLPIVLYQNRTLTLHPGDVLVVATDGFNESFNTSGELFGYDRLLALVGEVRAHSAHDIAHSLFAAVAHFAGRSGSDHTQTVQTMDDDQALLVLKGTGSTIEACTTRQKTIRLDMPAALECLSVPGASVAALLEGEPHLNEPEQTIYSVRLALHELCANIIEHAYSGEMGTISLTLTLTSQPRCLILETMDTGRPFDPTRVPDPDLLNERGRGLYLIRTLMDETTYDARTDQRWQSIGGQPWQPAALPHPQPGSNAWRLVRYL